MGLQIGEKNRKILLFIDKCVAHPRDNTALKNTEVIFLPPNYTSHLQPLGMWIIHDFKYQNTKKTHVEGNND